MILDFLQISLLDVVQKGHELLFMVVSALGEQCVRHTLNQVHHHGGKRVSTAHLLREPENVKFNLLRQSK